MNSEADFLDELPILQAQRSKLRDLGTVSAFELLSRIQASPDAFQKFYGRESTAELVAHLKHELTQEEASLLESTSPSFSLGAIVDSPGRFQPPPMDENKRETLLRHIETLRHEPDGEKRHRLQIEQLERAIASMY